MAARTVVFICTVILIISIFIKDVSAGTFAIDYDNDTFVKDGKPFRYISGSIHYSRVPAQYWDDRLHKIAAAGLNAIQTYIPWNFHEAEEGQYDFSDQRDVVTFLQIAQKYNLSVILRSGPYICGEWEFGGLPAWLLRQPGLKVRTMDPKFIKPVDTWMTKLYTTLKPLLYKNGGPIITVQIENEYGSYPACDYNYLRFLRDKARTMLGSDVVLFTTDGDGDGYLKCGTLPDVYATVDFGITYTPAKNFAIQRHKEPKGPLVNSEFYTGWLDHWGEKHSTTATAAVAKSLDLMLALGANVNMYMFEGGTNFGFWNGANYPFQPVPTSYDYDAPMTEAGDVTQKFMTLRSVIRKYNPVTMDVPPSTLKKAYGKVPMRFASTLVDHMDNSAVIPLSSVYPLTFEQLGHYYGFVVYKHVFRMAATGNLDLSGVRDRAYLTLIHNAEVSVNAVIERDNGNMTVPVSVSTGDYVLIIVENQGRINYGNHMNDNVKGLTTNVTLNNKPLEVWEQTGFSYNASQQVLFPTKTSVSKGYSMPSFYAGILVVDEPQDTYFDMSQWTKGQLYINSHNLGRYWPKKGPQVRLYVPKYYLSRGENFILMIELEQAPCLNISTCYVEFMDKPLINGTVDGAEDSSEKQADTFLARMIWLLLDLLYSGWEWLI
ncbi:beta-galactosidase-like isoform X2 [Mya arenaria]|uniref:beta-galactosidase-like isoform X2 n=1 Tax=Mya arenaria TaxID=6604 RepID=UPI0022E32289|nr:beta-galactosidase-like isoform X2 [Mya arenaria]